MLGFRQKKKKRWWALPLFGLLILSCQNSGSEDVTPPVPTLTSPAANGTTVIDIYTLRARVTDDQKVAGVAFMQESDTLGTGIQEGTSANYYYHWNTHGYANLDTVKNIYVKAVDGAGNSASSETRRVIVDNRGIAPGAVNLKDVAAPIVNGSADKYSLKLSWEPTNDYYFQKYLIYRDTTLLVDSTSTFIDSVTTRTQNTYLDTHAMAIQTTFFYTIYVAVADSVWSQPSNVRSGTTGDWVNTELDQAVAVGKHAIQIHWNRSMDPYLATYKVYRTHAANIDTTRDTLVFVTPDRNQNEFTDINLEQNTQYTFGVFITDSHGSVFATNTVTLKTLTLQPVPFVGASNVTKYTATLQWEPSSDEEFSGYRLTRSGDTTFTAVHDSLFGTPDISSTTFSDFQLSQNSVYYYYLWVVDPDTAVTGSPLEVRTRSITPVILNALEPGRYRFDMDWSAYIGVRNDFKAYVVTKTVNGVTTPVDTIRDQTTVSYTDENDIAYGVNHTYKIAVLDTNGGVGLSNGLIAEPLRINRANVVNLQPSGQEGLVLQWNWAKGPEPDFQAYQINRYSDLFVIQNGDTIRMADTLLSEVPATLEWNQSVTIATIENLAQLSYTDNSINQTEILYAYQIMVQDLRGNLEGGEVMGNFVAMTLPSVLMLSPTNITTHAATLNWAAAQAADSYLLYSNLDSTGMSRDNSVLQRETVNLQANVSGLGSGVTYWFAVWAKDSRGNYSERSNLVKVQTLF